MDGLLVLFQVLITLTFLFIGLVLLLGLAFGHEYRRNRYNVLLLKSHRTFMTRALLTTLIGVVLIETFLFVFGRQREWLLWVHLSFASPFLLSLTALVFRYTGLRFPVLHRRWGYVCIFIFYTGMLVTGIPLLFRR